MAHEGIFSVNLARRLKKLPTPDLKNVMSYNTKSMSLFYFTERLQQRGDIYSLYIIQKQYSVEFLEKNYLKTDF